VKRNK